MSAENKKSKLLFVIWRALFVFFGLAASIYMGYIEGVLEKNVRSVPSKFQIILVVIIFLVFLPSLLFIRNKSIKENNAEIFAKTTKFSWTLGIAAGGALICNVLAYLIPSLFS